MKLFADEVNEVLIHYHDVARAHGMDRALREAVESNVFTRRELAGVQRRVEELQRQLAGEVVEALDFLWREYVQADPATLTEDAKELAERVRQKVRELAGVQQLEARLAGVEAQAAQLRKALAQAVEAMELTHPMNPDEPCNVYEAWQQCKAALSSSAGRETAERLRLLEELADAATAFTERCTLGECHSRDGEPMCDEDPCLVERLKAIVRKLKGGDANAGTGS